MSANYSHQLQNLKKIYEEYANEYAQEKKIIDEDLKQFIDLFISYFEKGNKILDIGCGPGRDGAYYTEKGLIVHGIDFSKSMIEIAQREVPKATFEVKDMLNDEFGEELYDGVAANSSLLHIPKEHIGTVLDKVHKALKPKGIFWLGLKSGSGEHEIESDINGIQVKRFFVFYSKKEIKELLKLHNFSILHIETAQNRRGHWYVRVICRKV